MFDAARSQLSGIGRAATNLLSFVIAFGCTCAVLGWLVGFPKVQDIPDKLRVLQTDYRDCEVLFFGSSRVVHQIEPKLFDQTAAAAGRPVQSYNFGIDSLWPPESLFVLQELLKSPPPRLKWIFIELMPIEGTLRDGQDKMERTIYWHDRRHTNMAEGAMLERYPRWNYRLPLLWRHEMLWIQAASRQGEGAQLFHDCMWPEQTERKKAAWTRDAGFRAAPDEAMSSESRRWFTYTLETNGAELSRQETRLPHSLRRAYRPLLAEMRARGIEPIFFISPGLSRKTNYRDAPERAKLLSFARPDLYPELLKPELFRDRSHLNTTGTALFTPILARKFLEFTAPQP